MNETDAYRLDALLELAASFPAPLTAAEIARRRGVPARFLARLLGELARAGLVATARGPRGGVRLAVPPEALRVATLVRPEALPEAGGAAVGWLARRLGGARADALEPLTLADLARVEHEALATTSFDI